MSTTLVLRFADVGVATYASLRIIGQPGGTVTWVLHEPIVLAALKELQAALPDPDGDESLTEALDRALTRGPFATAQGELTLAYILGALLISAPAWQLISDCVADPRPVLFISPSARLARIPWGLLAVPLTGPDPEELIAARKAAVTFKGTNAARIRWQLDDIDTVTEGLRLMELADVVLAVPPNIAHAPRIPVQWRERRSAPALLVVDPRVPGQRPDSPLGSVLGRPSSQTALSRHFGELLARRPVLPQVDAAVELFRRTDADRTWLATLLECAPSRLLFVGHASAADRAHGYADRAALHLACTAAAEGAAEPVGNHRPLLASDLMAAALPAPPRVALLACGSGGDYQFDEATGLVAAMVLCGSELVTATLWSLPTTAGYRRFTVRAEDPMAEIVIAVDKAHEDDDAVLSLNRWQREQMRRWRDGDVTASPLYWAALVTFAVGGAR
ncbi:CHAT domain-containing protein [Mycobacterium sp. CVI_P3]|uniref:CHAT domain-containing protein n=1 Tax=Mycobacterium pinniadriaticum TaxID=2994102 RepID=A0ABT3S8Y8_9MYCO|nr:CHAT domain-containing protein [Mycobacterium pinniadriaticum]MCX2929542.1 CHAT domain-containing protein [Mycobacterium pinniadriaticum]MCX2935966.1 CHAT domain-containing protein [Mycobacterium pinniadriaticum]